jgi:hypothetical protein
MKRPYRLKWTDSCRHTRSFKGLASALKAARVAEPCKGVPCKWIITRGDELMAEGEA